MPTILGWVGSNVGQKRSGTMSGTMVSAYVAVSVEAGKNQNVVAALRQVAGVTQAHACWGQPDIFTYAEADVDSAMNRHRLRDHSGHPWRRDNRNPPRGAGVEPCNALPSRSALDSYTALRTLRR
jgi:hypothetical protein